MNKITRYLINSKVSRWSDLISDWGYIIILTFLILTVFILGRLGCGVSEIDSHTTQEKMEIKESNQTDPTLNPKKFDIYQSMGDNIIKPNTATEEIAAQIFCNL